MTSKILKRQIKTLGSTKNISKIPAICSSSCSYRDSSNLFPSGFCFCIIIRKNNRSIRAASHFLLPIIRFNAKAASCFSSRLRKKISSDVPPTCCSAKQRSPLKFSQESDKQSMMIVFSLFLILSKARAIAL